MLGSVGTCIKPLKYSFGWKIPSLDLVVIVCVFEESGYLWMIGPKWQGIVGIGAGGEALVVIELFDVDKGDEAGVDWDELERSNCGL